MNPIEKTTVFEGIMEEVIDNGTDGILPAMKLLFDCHAAGTGIVSESRPL